MSILNSWRQKIGGLFDIFGDAEPKNIGIYGPPNSGKTTLTNQILIDNSDIEEEELEDPCRVPHETRKANKQEEVEISIDENSSLTLSIVDTPGVSTQVDYEEFTDYGMEKEEAVDRSREATEGIAEAMHWLHEDIDSVIYVMDSTKDPFTQVNTMILGILENHDVPTIVLANKTDLEDSNIDRIRNAFPQYEVVPVSALHGENLDEVYEAIYRNFR